MKNLFKIKRPHRSSADTAAPPPPLQLTSSSPPSPQPQPPAASAAPPCSGEPPLAPAASAAPPIASAPAGERDDYFASEEEFQIQLAMALSASANGAARDRGDPDGDQIREATLLSLGRSSSDAAGVVAVTSDDGAGAAEALSRRYWDYNVLDYHEKVIDGFYDIFGLCTDTSGQEKMPLLSDLQTSIGDLGFEVIVVNREIDTSLKEMEQIAQCILLDCPVAEIALLVQRIAELVTDNLGGPVKDAGDMIARWMLSSSGLRTSSQSSLLPIGCIKVGLSRHRALLFKILADDVGIRCKLVKGSHYTGVDDDAVNIIKVDDGREFLVDLMAEPGTLIPADVLSSKGSFNSNKKTGQNLPAWQRKSTCSDVILGSSGTGNIENDGLSSASDNWFLVQNSEQENSDVGNVTAGTSGCSAWTCSQEQQNQLPTACATSSSKQKEVICDDVMKPGKVKPSAGLVEDADSLNLFAELNPFQYGRGVKPPTPVRASDNTTGRYKKYNENITSGPGRPPQPLVLKSWSGYSAVGNIKQQNSVETLPPRRNSPENVAPSSQLPRPTGKSSNVGTSGTAGTSNCQGMASAASKLAGSFAAENIYKPFINENIERGQHGYSNDGRGNCGQDGYLYSIQSSGDTQMWHENAGTAFPNMEHFRNGNRKKLNESSDLPKPYFDSKIGLHDKFMDSTMLSKDPGFVSPSESRPSRADPMLEDVSEWEILWEDLVIGERIGLGSYGEVYRADWNGTEVAVKKFLDQDFYGGALDEFRSEVRIMRRLRHPNIVLFMGAVTRPPNLSIVSEYLPRGSLYKILHRPNCPIDEKRRIKMAIDVAKGMNCLHTSVPTIVHRDLKSPNLLVDNNWTVKVCDFGLSRLKHSTFLSSKSTAGTPEWMAPEVLRNELSNEKCDVYSFGVILWELATLRMPWSGMNPMQVVGAVGFQDRRLEIPKEIDPLVAGIIWECWQTDPSLRPSFAQLTTALKTLERLVIPTHQETSSPVMHQEISVNTTP